ncbi:glycosyltransferase family 4 protein [Microvirga sp. 2YAF29]|uniref:glycosyltransferase family 4 protein n=1 Tax=Microvirga sp. 2YAF29 TaxID=3233031 RepID=UPI003F965A3D
MSRPETSLQGQGYVSLAVIAFEFPPFPGGISTYADNIARTIARTHPVTIIAPRYDEVMPVDHGMSVYRPLRHQTLNIRGVSKALWKLARMEKRTLLHCADIRSGLVGLLANVSYGRPYTVMVHGSEVLKISPKRPDYPLLKSIYRRARRVVANSASTAGMLKERIDGLNECVVAHLGVDGDWFDEIIGPFTSPQLSKLQADDNVFCTLGRLERRKGHLTALKAITEYQRLSEYGNIKYVIAGKVIDPAYEAEIRAAAAELPFEVILTGALAKEDIRRLFRMARCQLLLAASMVDKIEGFGLVILEAAAQGCPTIATRVGGIPEVIENGITGYVTDEGDVPAAALAIERIQDHTSNAAMRIHCLTHAQTFTWERCAHASFDALLAFEGGASRDLQSSGR